jgi:hypothetical protein
LYFRSSSGPWALCRRVLDLLGHHDSQRQLIVASRFELAHVEVHPASQPLLALFDAQGGHEPQARLRVGEDPHHPRSALQLLVEALQAVGATDAQAVLGGHSSENPL